jgi:sulfur relay (sulfurtransferase) complex TusBCD TusD component (DsrE family)
MPSYLLIESRDPFESAGYSRRCELAIVLLTDGAGVTLFLIENGVIASRAAARVPELEKLAKAGVSILADEFALRERGIAVAELAACVKSTRLEMLVEMLGAGARALWN